MSRNSNNNNDTQWGMGILCFGVLFFIVCLICCGPVKEKTAPEPEYIYYNVPTYTTIYEIVYPDSAYRYTAVHHSPSRLSSYKGTNSLYSATHDADCWGDRDRPDYWMDEWNSSELDVSTTAPIRVVSETVKYEKKKYIKRK